MVRYRNTLRNEVRMAEIAQKCQNVPEVKKKKKCMRYSFMDSGLL